METETRIALLEQGKLQMVADINELKADVKEIKSLLINSLVTHKDFQEYKASIRSEMETTKNEYNERLAAYQKSQFWQKMMTFLGGVGLSIITAVLLYEVSKILK